MAQAKLFRIERMLGLGVPALQAAADTAETLATAGAGAATAPGPGLTLAELAALRDRVAEAARLQEELAELSAAIDRTKREIAALHYEDNAGDRFEAAGSELEAVVKATEAATDGILAAAERIENLAANLSAAAVDAGARVQAEEIAEHVVAIFEACNFQDITGQRITKVVQTLEFVEERVAGMMDIWGGARGLAAFAPPRADSAAVTEDEAALLNGPALDEAEGHATQDDIDALFA